MKKSFFIALLILSVFFTGTTFAQFPKYLYGVISIFNDDYNGKTTASGETYDPDQLTASHQTLPFGTELQIENLENGRKATVRIIDRGPLSDNRIMEVSREAADRLGFIKKGTVYSKITLVKIGDNKVKTSSPSAPSNTGLSPVEPAVETTSSAPSGVIAAPEKVDMVPVTGTPTVTAPVLPQVNTITKTNKATLYETNIVEVTNYNDMTLTNMVDIPPYEDKYIELPVNDRKTTDMQAIQDEFILDEPSDMSGEKSSEPAQIHTSEPELPFADEKVSGDIEVPVEKTPDAVKRDKDEPETLLLNEEAVNIEKNESQGEALLEVGKKGNFNLVVQAGAFRKEGNALRFYDTLRAKGYEVFSSEAKVRGKKWYRVRIGYFDSLDSAKQVISRLKKSGIKAFLVKIKK